MVADRFGRRVTIAGILLTYSSIDLLCATSLGTRLSFLRVFGVATGGLTGSCLSIMPTVATEVLPARHREVGGAALYTPLGIGFMVGPWVAGIIVSETRSYLGAKLLAGVSLAVGGACSVVAGWVPLRNDPGEGNGDGPEGDVHRGDTDEANL